MGHEEEKEGGSGKAFMAFLCSDIVVPGNRTN